MLENDALPVRDRATAIENVMAALPEDQADRSSTGRDDRGSDARSGPETGDPGAPATASAQESLSLSASSGFGAWLQDHALSIAFTTYQVGKLFAVGVRPEGRLSTYERTFSRCMGLYASPDAQTLYMSSLYQLWRFENHVAPGDSTSDGFDAVYVPEIGTTTGDIDIHDVHVDGSGRPVFCVTRYNCLGTTSETHSFRPLWRPSFISALVAEDRCHLNGLAMDPVTGEPAYVTVVSRSDVVGAWRERRDGSGMLVDVRTNEVVLDGLSMPHSPRVDPDDPSRVWLLNAGTGHVGFVDLRSSRRSFTEVAFCPGFTRGMAFAGHHLVVGLSAARADRTFKDLPLDDNLLAKGAEARCAIHVIDRRSGTVVEWLRFDSLVRELYDVVTLNSIRRPKLLGFRTPEIHNAVRIEPD